MAASSPTTQQDAAGLAPQSIVQIGAASGPSAFDTHRAPELAVMDKCVHCGFCLPACPTYVLWGDEMDSPRGRIWMMRKATTGEATLDPIFQQHIDACLGCMSCVTACPSGVEYNKLIEDTRGQLERHVPRSLPERLFRKLLFLTFPHPRRLRWLGVPLAIYQRSGLQRLLRRSGLLKLLPRRLQAMESLLPPVPLNPFHSLPSTVSKSIAAPKRGRVGLLTGCVQDAFFSHVNAASIRVLAAAGFEVAIPKQQGCCGALMLHSGLDDQAAAYAKRLITTFEAAQVDTIVINAAGCGSTMKEYGHLLRDDPAWAVRAAAFSARCKDISEVFAGQQVGSVPSSSPLSSFRSAAQESAFGAVQTSTLQPRLQNVISTGAQPGSPASVPRSLGWGRSGETPVSPSLPTQTPIPDGHAYPSAQTPTLHPLPLRVAYHDACHLRHAQAIHEQPRTLLRSIPGLEIAEIAESHLCCGSAGVYNLLNPETADELGDRKAEHLLATGAEAVVSANPGCLLQLMSALRRRGAGELPTFHMVELLDASLRGLTREQLLHGRRSTEVDPAKTN